MKVDVSNKVVLVTGSSRGIGSHIVKRLAAEQAKVVINYNKSYQKALELFQEILKINPHCIMIKADVTKQKDVAKLCDQIIEHFGTIDVLVNNAGICDDNLLLKMSEEQWQEVIDVNLTSVFMCSKIFSKEMMKRGQGKIINISSYKGQIGFEGQTNYCASKAGINAFTKALAKELGAYNISVNAICPGFIITDLNREKPSKRMIAESSSLLHTENNLNDLINFIIFLSSGSMGSVTGQIFNIDSRV